MTTHNKGVIDELGRRVITMDEGRIVRDDANGKYILLICKFYVDRGLSE